MLIACGAGCGDGGTPEDTFVEDAAGDVIDDTGTSDTAIPDEGHPIDLAVPDTGDDVVMPDIEPTDSTETGPGDTGTDYGPDAGCVDDDGDGYGPGCPNGNDCAPADRWRFKIVDVYQDVDMDGFGVEATVALCTGDTTPIGYSTAGGDCDDTDPRIFPGAPEIPDDGRANGCSGADLTAAAATEGIFVVAGMSDDNAGDRANPVGTLGAAMLKAAAAGVTDIFVANGTFAESLIITQEFRFHGGYESATWTRAAKYSRINGVTTATVTVDDGEVVFDRFEIFGTTDDALVNAESGVSAVVLKNAVALFVEVNIGGSGVDTTGPDNSELQVTGVHVESSNVMMVGCRIGDGGPVISRYSGTGQVTREITSRGILVVSGELRMLGGLLGIGAEMTLDGLNGVITGGVKARGISVTGGKAVIAAVDVDGSATVDVTNVGEDGTTATATAIADGAGAEVSGTGELWLVNSVIGAGQVTAYSEVYASGTAGAPVTGVSTAILRAAPVVAMGGRLIMAHCDLHTDRYSEATSEASTTFGTENATKTQTVNLVRVADDADALIINSAGYNQINTDDSSLITVHPGARMNMFNSVWWDMEYGVCRVYGEDACLIADGGLDTLADQPGCERASGNLVQDQLWGWWDSVTAGSPLPDGGINPASEGMGVFIDADGNPRPNGEGWDIGAYEFN